METVLIKDFPHYIDQVVIIKGWMVTHRSSGKIAFLQLRDGTGSVQCVISKNDVAEEMFEAQKNLTMESSVEIHGKVIKDDRAPTGFEVHAQAIQILHLAEPFPITKLKEGESHGIDFLLTNRHLWLRSSRQITTMHIRNEVIKAMRDYFYQQDFICIDTPILTGSIGESASTLFQTEYFDLGTAYLAQTGQLYLESAIFAHNRVYCFGPTFRAEKSKTRRHLNEFWMLEAEAAFFDNKKNMDLQEDFLSYVVQRVLETCKEDLKAIERDTTSLTQVVAPFPRISYDEAIQFLKEDGAEKQWGDDITGADETLLSKRFNKPVFIYNYPKESVAFYMKTNPENPKTALNADLIAPEGYGEIIGGSQREENIEVLIASIKEKGLPQEAYEWYLDLRRYGSVEHSGFGIGLERTVAWICGSEHIRECIPFPRTLYRLYP